MSSSLRKSLHLLMFDGGMAFIAAYVVGALSLGVASQIAVARINAKWPAISLHEKSLQAIKISSAGLDKFQDGAFTLHAAASDISTLANGAIASAVRSYQAQNPSSGARVENISTRFDQQLVEVSFDFVFPVPDQRVVVRGSATGLAFVALDGETLTILPAVQRIRLTHIDGRLFWVFKPPVFLVQSLLDTFMANINGAIQPISQKIPIAPFTAPGAPLNTVTATVPDPMTPNHSIVIAVTAPILGASAMLIDQTGIAVMGDLRLAGETAPSADASRKGPTFTQYKAAFHTVAKRSGIEFDGSSSFLVSQPFIQRYFDKYLLSISAAGVVDQAIQDGAKYLTNLGTATTGVRIKNQVITDAVSSLIDSQMPSWLAKAPLSTAKPAQTKAGGQAITSTIEAHVVFQQGSIDGSLVAVAAPSGGIAEFIVRPAIGAISLSNAAIGDYTNLNGMLIGVNTILAGAAQAVNAQIAPLVIPVKGFGADTINLQSSAPAGVTVSPAAVTLPAVALADASVLIDDDELKVMARFSTDPIAPAVTTATHVSFDEYRQDFLNVWGTQMPGGGDAQTDASVYQAGSSLSGYLNQSWPATGISITTSMSGDSHVSQDLKLNLIQSPSISCSAPISCNCDCKWWNLPCKAACEACHLVNDALVLACSVAKAGIDLQIAALNAIIGNLRGTFSADTHASASGGIYGLKMNFASNFSGIKVSGSAGATASVGVAWHLQPKDLGILVCVAPVGGHPTWSATGSIAGLPNFGLVLAPYSESGGMGIDIAITNDPFTGTVTMPDPPLNRILTDLTLIGIDCPITMPVVSLLHLVNGVANIDRIALEKVLHDGADDSVWSMVKGEFKTTVPSMTFHVRIPPPEFVVGGTKLTGSLTHSAGWFRADLVVQR